MKFKFILISFVALMIGTYLGITIFKSYDSEYVFNNNSGNTIYFLQQGAYSSVENLEKNTKNVSKYIYFKEDKLYKVYVLITTDKEVANKVKDIYKEKGIDVYVKESLFDKEDFYNQLKQYDMLLKTSNDEEAIFNLIYQILEEYKLVMENKK